MVHVEWPKQLALWWPACRCGISPTELSALRAVHGKSQRLAGLRWPQAEPEVPDKLHVSQMHAQPPVAMSAKMPFSGRCMHLRRPVQAPCLAPWCAAS